MSNIKTLLSVVVGLVLLGLTLGGSFFALNSLGFWPNRQALLEPVPPANTQPEQEAEARLNNYGWIDQKANLVHIPISQAMAALARSGLPVGSENPAATGQEKRLVLFRQVGCSDCHGSDAGGDPVDGVPNLRSTSLSYQAVLQQVRTGKGEMPAFSKDQVSDEQVQTIYDWVQTLKRVEPTFEFDESAFPTPIPEVAQVVPPTVTLPPPATPTPINSPVPSAQPPSGAETLPTEEPTTTPIPADTSTATSVPPTDTPVAPTATPLPQIAVAIEKLIAAQQSADSLKVAADYAKDASATIEELHNHVNEGLAAAQALQNAINNIRPEATGNLLVTLDELQAHLNNYLSAAQAAAGTGDLAAGKAQAALMVLEGRLFVLPLAQQVLVDAGSGGVVRGRVVDQSGQGLANALVTVAFGRYKRGIMTDAQGFFTAANIPAIKPIEVKAYQSGFIYHEEHTELAPGGIATIQITLPTQGSNAPNISVSDFSVTPTGNGTTLSMRAVHPANNLAEDQIFALNPTLGIAVTLLGQGGDIYQATVPFAPNGRWYFFAVDHSCFSSNIMPLDFQ
ncbi:MAG: c-type cytochrome [Chloroflexi bacterium]|nr:c-type cytochrome [Chloroflexota bacterium]